MKDKTGIVFKALLLAVAYQAGVGEAWAQSGGEAANRVEVLNNDSYVREFKVFRTPVQVGADGQVTTCQDLDSKEPKAMADFQSPLPPAGWMKAEFDDFSWARNHAPVELQPTWAGKNAAMHTATVNALICLRWKFLVDDPAKVQDLLCSMDYVGGVALYLNGQEIKRSHLPDGELKPDTLAEKYPDDLYCQPDNKFLSQRWPGDGVVNELLPAFERRYRRLDRVAIPAKFLTKGVNVLAVQIHRAPINAPVLTTKRFEEGGMYTKQGMWAYAGLKSLNLTAAPIAALAPNIGRPKGVQVWTCPSFETITAYDFGDLGQAQPVRVHASRNGVFSGRLVVSADETIQKLQVAVTDLVRQGGGGVLPSAAVQVRYAEPAMPEKCWLPAPRFDGLLEAIPAAIPVRKLPVLRYKHLGQEFDRPVLTSGALAPLWLSCRVPADAKPGVYEGQVSIQADNLSRQTVPLRVTVSAWRTPAPKDFRVQSFAYLSEDALAKRYETPLWSDKHLELMGKSMALMAEVNSRQVIVNLCVNAYGGNKGAIDCSNEETLIRWIKQNEPSTGPAVYKYDFTDFDRFLDMAAKTIGKPGLLRVNCWAEVKKGKDGEMVMAFPSAVTLLDPATGKRSVLAQPMPGTEESFVFWKPVLDEVRKRVEARGWWDVTALGHSSYCYPPIGPVVSVAKRIWPDGVWSYTAHNGTMGGSFGDKGATMPCRYADAVWTMGRHSPRGSRALLQPRPTFWCYTWRTVMRDASSLALLRSVLEDEIMRGHDGVSDFGADLFPIKNANGRYTCLGNGRGTGGPSCSTQAMLAPGPNGALGTERFEMLREGTEIAEAILFLEKALLDKKVSDVLALKINACLDARSEAFLKNWTEGRFEQDAALLMLAGEVSEAL